MQDGPVIGATLQVDTAAAVASVKDMKKELKEANAELIYAKKNFGDLSPQALNAAKKVTELKDEIKDAKEVSDLFDPGAKFQAFGNVVRTITGGFSALTGAMALVGVENENITKSIQRLQAVLALTEGVNTIVDAAKDFQRLNALIQASTIYQKANAAATALASNAMKLFGISVTQTSTAFNVLKGAIVATGLGALVVAIGLVIQYMQSFSEETETAAEKQERLAKETERLNNALRDQAAWSDRASRVDIAAAKARGASLEEIAALEKKAIENRISLTQTALDDAKRKGADTLKLEETLLNEEINLRIQGYNEQDRLRLKGIESDKKKLEEQKKLAEKRKEQLKESLEREKSALEELQKLRDDNFINSISDEIQRDRQRVVIDAKRNRERVEALKITEETKSAIIIEINKAEQREIDKINKSAVESRKLADAERLEAGYADIQAKIAQYKTLSDAQAELDFELRNSQADQFTAQLNNLDKWYKEKQRIAGENELLQNQLTQQYEDQRTAITRSAQLARLNIVSSLLGQASELFGKQTAVGKTLAIAEATMNTYAGATLALREKSILPQPFSTIQKIASAGLIIGAGLKSVYEIAKAKVPGTSSSAGVGGSVAASAPLTPALPSAGTTSLDRDTIQSINSNPVRAFVNQSDITESQEVTARLNRQARLGG